MRTRYEALLEHARDIILFIGADGRILEANRAASLAYGFSREELEGMHIGDLRAKATHGDIAPQINAALQKGILFETMHRRKDGSTFPVEVSSKSISDDGKVLVSVIRDITARKQAEEELYAAHAALEAKIEERTAELARTNRALAERIEALTSAQETIAAQAEELFAVSTPVLPLWRGLIVLPLIGELDEMRIERLMERLLAGVVEGRARVALIDVTGVPTLTDEAVEGLAKAVRAARLLGAEVILTGIRAEAARTFSTCETAVTALATHATLARGLAAALRKLSGSQAAHAAH